MRFPVNKDARILDISKGKGQWLWDHYGNGNFEEATKNFGRTSDIQQLLRSIFEEVLPLQLRKGDTRLLDLLLSKDLFRDHYLSEVFYKNTALWREHPEYLFRFMETDSLKMHLMIAQNLQREALQWKDKPEVMLELLSTREKNKSLLDWELADMLKGGNWLQHPYVRKVLGQEEPSIAEGVAKRKTQGQS